MYVLKLSSQQKGYSTYQKAQADEREQSELILMMFAGGISFLDKALDLAETDKVEIGKYVSKTKNVLLELMSSLNIENSRKMSEILLRAYRGLFNKLNTAHMTDNTQKISEVRDSLAELEDAWKQVFNGEEYIKFKKDSKYIKVINSA